MPHLNAAHAIVLRSPALEVELLAEGASVRSIRMAGVGHSLVLGAHDPAVYGPGNRSFLGASVGRHANRIAHSAFTLDGRTHSLSVNEPPHHLHGGSTGFWARRWSVKDVTDRRAVFGLSSPDGEDGYPGNADILATFSLDEDDTLAIDYDGTIDRPGILNLTSHLYFNLSGAGPTRDHVLRLASDAYLPVDAELIPNGEVRSVRGTGFDFRAPKSLADGPDSLDHCFCLAEARRTRPQHALSLVCERAGILLDLDTTEPGVQIYDGAKFDGQVIGLDGRGIGAHGGIAIEPQGWPNAPNEPAFPSPVQRPGEAYRHRSLYRFGRL